MAVNGAAAPPPPADPPPPPAPSPAAQGERDLRSAALVSVLLLSSRVTGAYRDHLQAAEFGRTWVADAFNLAYSVPNIFRMLFGEGALSAALVPIFSRMEATGEPERGRRILRGTFTVLAAVLAGLVLLGEAGCGAALAWIGRARAAGAPPADGGRPAYAVEELVLKLLQAMLPYVVLVCLVALLISFLHARRRFALPALTQTVFNAVMSLFLLAAGWFGTTPEERVWALPAAVLVGGLCQLLVQMPALRREGVSLRPLLPRGDPAYGEALRTMAPVLFGLSIFQMNTLLDRLIALYVVRDEGAVSVLYYGNRLFWFPLSLVGVAIATTAFPTLAREALHEDRGRLSEALSSSLRSVLFLSVPAALGLILLRAPLVRFLFEYRHFDAAAAERTSKVVLCYGLGLWATCAVPVLSRCFYALGNTRTPAAVGTGIVLLNLALNLAFAGPFREAGLALATSISTTAQVVIFAWILSGDRFRVRASVGSPYFLRILAASALMAAVCLGTRQVVPPLPPGLAEGIRRAWAVGVPLFAGIVSYFAAAALLRVPEARRLLSVLRRPAPDAEEAEG